MKEHQQLETCGQLLNTDRFPKSDVKPFKEKRFFCASEGCDAAFTKKVNLTLHNERKHGAPTTARLCLGCYVMLPTQSAYLYHRSLCGKEHKCKMCHYVTKTRSNLTRHISRMHKSIYLNPDVKPDPAIDDITLSTSSIPKKSPKQTHFLCSVCGKEFSSAASMREHQRMELGDFRYCCNICGKQFMNHARFRSHELQHIGEKPYACQQEGCDATYAHKHSLVTHMETKHGLLSKASKPKNCPICNMEFTSAAKYAGHRALCGKEYRCHLCGYITNNRSNLNRHTSRRHKNISA